MVAHALDKVHDVAGDDDGATGLDVIIQDVADIGRGDGIDRFAAALRS